MKLDLFETTIESAERMVRANKAAKRSSMNTGLNDVFAERMIGEGVIQIRKAVFAFAYAAAEATPVVTANLKRQWHAVAEGHTGHAAAVDLKDMPVTSETAQMEVTEQVLSEVTTFITREDVRSGIHRKYIDVVNNVEYAPIIDAADGMTVIGMNAADAAFDEPVDAADRQIYRTREAEYTGWEE